jgi:hypothetical protein
VDVVSLFAIAVFSCAWYFFARTARDERLVRLFFGFLMFFGAGAGFLGIAMRFLQP